ncbi:MAG: MotB family protein [Gammaproteobacteria bacterium]
MAEEECPKCPEGLPPWLATFADLMSLLMCFFVLLLSFATIDAVKFKKMAESMKDAFGVQREIPAAEIVMGVSVIKREFSPTIAEESIVEQVKQQTTETRKENLEMKEPTPETTPEVTPEVIKEELEKQELKEQLQEKLEQEAKDEVAELQEALDQEIEAGQVAVEREGSKVIIRIQEKGSFASGSASLDPEFFEVMDKITAVLQDKSGKIVVAGHTDNIPIRTGRFRSNWELSSARAVTVLHAMLRNPNIEDERVLVVGHAYTNPLVYNDTQ